MVGAIKKLFGWLYGVLKPFDVSGHITRAAEALSDYMGWVNWLVPFNTLTKIYTAWLLCISAYFIFKFCKPSVDKIIEKILTFVKIKKE